MILLSGQGRSKLGFFGETLNSKRIVYTIEKNEELTLNDFAFILFLTVVESNLETSINAFEKFFDFFFAERIKC